MRLTKDEEMFARELAIVYLMAKWVTQHIIVVGLEFDDGNIIRRLDTI